jgi:ABC-type multidrug transport system fused ATPase/permease subunit
MTTEGPRVRVALRRIRERQELQLAAALSRADRPMAAGWWSLLAVRGILPASFSIATGVLVGAIQHQASLAVPLIVVGVLFIGLQVLGPLHTALSANLGDRTSAWLYDELTGACVAVPGTGHLEDPELAADLQVARDFDRGMTGPPLSVSMADGMPAHHIRFRDVTFAYPAAPAHLVLDGLDLEIPAGSSLAIVGQNGAGKTTLAKLLCRLYDPQAGAIEVDGVDLKDLDTESWRRRVTAVFQDFVRFELTLRENVAPRETSALYEAPALDETVTAALAEAGAHGLAGLDTVLAKGYSGGTDLSGGQWQRVALARALSAVRLGAGLVLLDEPTAQLDVRGEAEIFERVLAATRSCTTVLISHRFSTVRHVDRIAVVEHGAVVEFGSHEELMAQRGRYWTMFSLQAKRFAEGTPEEGEEEVTFDVLT